MGTMAQARYGKEASSEGNLTADESRSVVLHGVRWQIYEDLLEDLGPGGTKLTYDRGSLEIMTPVYRHESYAGFLGRLVEIAAEEFGLPFVSGWSTTFRRADLKRGLEPDRCFYIKNVAAVLGKTDLDLRRDPPPDLAIEVDIMSSSLDRLSIYAALGVPEVWRVSGGVLRIHHRKTDDDYEEVSRSPTFPTLPLVEVLTVIEASANMDDSSRIKALRNWVQSHSR
jgi:Uma2 family endonuclease